MNNDYWITYLYENSNGVQEEIEMSGDISPPLSLSMPSPTGRLDIFMLVGDDFDAISE